MFHRSGLLLQIWRSCPWRQWARLISLLLCLTFVLPYLAFAFDTPTPKTLATQAVLANGLPLEIPSDLGTIVKSHAGVSRGVVVYIQDLHCNAEVQNHIAGILAHLAKKYGIGVVGVEGASRPIDVSQLSSVPVAEVKAEVGQYFLKAGKISGAEYSAAAGQAAIRLEGVENPALYEADRSSVKKFLSDESQGYVYDLRETLEKLKDSIYSTALRAHDRRRVAFREGKEGLLRHALYLAAGLKQAGQAPAAYPDMQKYVSENMERFGTSLDPDGLYRDMDRADEILRAGLIGHQEERQLGELEKRLDIIEKLLNISASPEELAAYRQNPESFRVSEFLNFIQAQDAGPELALDAEIQGLDEFVKETETFYRVADARSISFVGTLEAKLKAAPSPAGVLITGGYHTEEVLRELEKRGWGYVSVKPKITQADLANPYFSLLREKRTPLEKLLAQNQNILALPTQFREVGLEAREGVRTFSKFLDLSIKQDMVVQLVRAGVKGVAALAAGFAAKLKGYRGGKLEIAWEGAQGNEASQTYLLPIKSSNLVGVVHPRPESLGAVPAVETLQFGADYDVSLLDARVAQANAPALLGGRSTEANGKAAAPGQSWGWWRQILAQIRLRFQPRQVLGIFGRQGVPAGKVMAAQAVWEKFRGRALNVLGIGSQAMGQDIRDAQAALANANLQPALTAAERWLLQEVIVKGAGSTDEVHAGLLSQPVRAEVAYLVIRHFNGNKLFLESLIMQTNLTYAWRLYALSQYLPRHLRDNKRGQDKFRELHQALSEPLTSAEGGQPRQTAEDRFIQQAWENQPHFKTLVENEWMRNEALKVYLTAVWLSTLQAHPYMSFAGMGEMAKKIDSARISEKEDEANQFNSSFLFGLPLVKRYARSPSLLLMFLEHEVAHELLHGVGFGSLKYGDDFTASLIVHEIFADLAAFDLARRFGKSEDITGFEEELSYDTHARSVAKGRYFSGDEHAAARAQLRYLLDTLRQSGVPVDFQKMIRVFWNLLEDRNTQVLQLNEVIALFLVHYIQTPAEISLKTPSRKTRGLFSPVQSLTSEHHVLQPYDLAVIIKQAKGGRQPLTPLGAVLNFGLSLFMLGLSFFTPLVLLVTLPHFAMALSKVGATIQEVRRLQQAGVAPGWTQPLATYDPADGRVRDYKGTILAKPNMVSLAHEHFAHRWVHAGTDFMLKLLKLPTMTQNALLARQGRITLGYLLVNQVWGEVLAHALDFLAVPFAVAEYYLPAGQPLSGWLRARVESFEYLLSRGLEKIEIGLLLSRARSLSTHMFSMGLLALVYVKVLPVTVALATFAFPILLSLIFKSLPGSAGFGSRVWRELTWPNRRLAATVAVLGVLSAVGGVILTIAFGAVTAGTVTLTVVLFVFSGLLILWGLNYYFRTKMIITLDGPDVSGKRDIAMALAKEYQYAFLDTGIYLRVLALKLQEQNQNIALLSPQALEKLLRDHLGDLAGTKVSMSFQGSRQELSIRMDAGDVTSEVLGVPGQEAPPALVALASQLGHNAALMELLRSHILQEAKKTNLVVVGQSMGAFLDKEAKIKFYVTGDLKTRAEHYLRQRLKTEPTWEQLVETIHKMRQQEKADRSRSVAPLKSISDAQVIDSTRPDAVQKVRRLINERSSVFYSLRQHWERLQERTSRKMLPNASGNRLRRERLVLDGDLWEVSSDVDNFSSINPFWGKGIGNVLLADIQAARVEALRLPNVRSLTRDAFMFREGGDEATLVLPPKLLPQQVQEVADAQRIHVKSSLYKKYLALELPRFTETPGNLETLRAIAQNLNRQFNAPDMFRVINDDVFGVRLLLTVRWPEGGPEFYIDQLSVALRLQGLSGKVERLRLTDILTPENRRRLGQVNLDYLEQGFVWMPTVSLGGTKATRALSEEGARDMQQRWAKKKLTHADLTDWVEALTRCVGDFLRQAKSGPGSGENTNDGKDAAVIDYQVNGLARTEDKSKPILIDANLKDQIQAEVLLHDDHTTLLDDNDQHQYDGRVPWALSTTALRKSTADLEAELSPHGAFEPEILIGRAPPATGPDKIHLSIVTPQKTYLVELEGEYSGPLLEAALREILGRKLTGENMELPAALRLNAAMLHQKIEALLDEYTLRQHDGQRFFKFSALNLISYATGNQMILAPHFVLSSLEVQRRFVKRLQTGSFEEALADLMDVVEGQINTRFNNPIKISLTAVEAFHRTTAVKPSIGRTFHDVYIASLSKAGRITAYSDALLKPARAALKQLAAVRWNRLIERFTGQSEEVAATRARELIEAAGQHDRNRVQELLKYYQNLSLPFTLLATGVSAVLLFLGLGVPLAAPVVVALFLMSASKLGWVVAQLRGRYGKDWRAHWTEAMGAFDPVSGSMVNPKTGEAVSTAPVLVLAHEQYAHAWVQRLVDAWQTFWDEPTLADYSRAAETGHKTLGYYFWNVLVSELLAHALDFLAVPVAFVQSRNLLLRQGAVVLADLGLAAGLVIFTFLPLSAALTAALPVLLILGLNAYLIAGLRPAASAAEPAAQPAFLGGFWTGQVTQAAQQLPLSGPLGAAVAGGQLLAQSEFFTQLLERLNIRPRPLEISGNLSPPGLDKELAQAADAIFTDSVKSNLLHGYSPTQVKNLLHVMETSPSALTDLSPEELRLTRLLHQGTMFPVKAGNNLRQIYLSPERLQDLRQAFGAELFPTVLQYLLMHELVCARDGHQVAVARVDALPWPAGINYGAILSALLEESVAREDWEFYSHEIRQHLARIRAGEAGAREDFVGFLDAAGRVIDERMKDFPVEAKYPLLQAVALLSEEETAELVEVLKEEHAGFKSSVAESILLNEDVVPEGWFAKNAPQLKGRKIYLVSPEITYLAGGLGYVMQVHARFMKRLGADVACVEPRYVMKKTNDGRLVPLDYFTEYMDTARGLQEAGRFKLRDGTEVKILRGYRRDDGMELLLLEEVGKVKYTNVVYDYSSQANPSAINPATWEEFGAFFGKASVEALELLERERRGQSRDAWKPAVVLGNDAQSAVLSALLKVRREDNTSALKDAHSAFTSHTFGNRHEPNVKNLDNLGRLMDLGEVPKRFWSAFIRLNEIDNTSGGVRLSDSAFTVSRKQKLVVESWDPDARLVAVTNGDDIRQAREQFGAIYQELYQAKCNFKQITPQEIREVKHRAKEKLALALEALGNVDERLLAPRVKAAMQHQVPAAEAAGTLPTQEAAAASEEKRLLRESLLAQMEAAAHREAQAYLVNLKGPEKQRLLQSIGLYVDPEKPFAFYGGRLVTVKFNMNRSMTEGNLKRLVGKGEGKQLVVFGRLQAHGDSWGLEARLDRVIGEITQNREEYPGNLAFVRQYGNDLKQLLLIAGDVLVLDSDDRTGTCEFTEINGDATFCVIVSPPWRIKVKQWLTKAVHWTVEIVGEGIIGAQGIIRGTNQANIWNTVVPKDAHPDSYFTVIKELLDMAEQEPEEFYTHAYQSGQIAQILNASNTSAGYLKELNDDLQHEADARETLDRAVAGFSDAFRRRAAAGDQQRIAQGILYTGLNEVKAFGFHVPQINGLDHGLPAVVSAQGEHAPGLKAFLDTKKYIEKNIWDGTLGHLQSGDYMRTLRIIFNSLPESESMLSQLEAVLASPDLSWYKKNELFNEFLEKLIGRVELSAPTAQAAPGGSSGQAWREKTAANMSIGNVAFSAVVYGALAVLATVGGLANLWWLAGLIAVVAGWQIAIIYSLWSRANAARAPAERTTFWRWFWETRGGVVASTTYSGLLPEYRPYATGFVREWFRLHERTEDHLPFGGVFGHLFASSLDGLSGAVAWLLWGRNILGSRHWDLAHWEIRQVRWILRSLRGHRPNKNAMIQTLIDLASLELQTPEARKYLASELAGLDDATNGYMWFYLSPQEKAGLRFCVDAVAAQVTDRFPDPKTAVYERTTPDKFDWLLRRVMLEKNLQPEDVSATELHRFHLALEAIAQDLATLAKDIRYPNLSGPTAILISDRLKQFGFEATAWQFEGVYVVETRVGGAGFYLDGTAGQMLGLDDHIYGPVVVPVADVEKGLAVVPEYLRTYQFRANGGLKPLAPLDEESAGYLKQVKDAIRQIRSLRLQRPNSIFRAERDPRSFLFYGSRSATFRRIMRIYTLLPAPRRDAMLRAGRAVLDANRASLTDFAKPEYLRARWSPTLEIKVQTVVAELNAQIQSILDTEFRQASPELREDLKDWYLLTLLYRFDPNFSFPHSWWVGQITAEMASVFGKANGVMDLSRNEIEVYQRAGWLHDIGKILLPLGLLHKTQEPTAIERALLQVHAPVGTRLLEGLGYPSRIIDGTRHHEWLNGEGYPLGLKAGQISALTLAVTLGDAYEAVISSRPYVGYYKDVMSILQELEDLSNGTAARYDPSWYAALKLIGQRQIAGNHFAVFDSLEAPNGPDPNVLAIAGRSDEGPASASAPVIASLRDFVYQVPLAARQGQIHALLEEIGRELVLPGSGRLPRIVAISDVHGDASRFRALLSDVFRQQLGFKGVLAENQPIEAQLRVQGLSLKNLNAGIYISGDLAERGGSGLQCVDIIRELQTLAPRQVFYILGERDLASLANLRGLHLPWYEGYNFHHDHEAEVLLSGHRRLDPSHVNSRAWWAERLAEYNADRSAFENESGARKLQDLRPGFLRDYSRFSVNWTEQQLSAWEEFTGSFVRLDVPAPAIGLNGLGQTSGTWWRRVQQELIRGHEARRGIAGDAELDAWERAIFVAGQAVVENETRSHRALEEGKWWYRIFESINTQAFVTLEWMAKDWSSHKGWGETLIAEANALRTDGQKYTQANYISSPELQGMADFFEQQASFYQIDPYGNLYTHGWLPVDAQNQITVSYRSRVRSGRGIFALLRTLSDDIREGGGNPSRLAHALSVANQWYADKSTRIKPADLERYRTQGIAAIQNLLRVRNWFTGHNERNTMKVPFMRRDGVFAHFEINSGLSAKSGGPRGYALVGANGVVYRGFESETNREVVEAPETRVGNQVISNPGLRAQEYLTIIQAALEDELQHLAEGEQPAMSLANAFVSGAVYAGLSLFFGWGGLAALAGLIFGAQIALMVRLWRGFNAAQDPAQRQSFWHWFITTRGGVVATPRARGLREEYRAYADVFTSTWFRWHESVENILPFKYIPGVGPLLNHLVASLSDGFSALVAAAVWGRNVLRTSRETVPIEVAEGAVPAAAAPVLETAPAQSAEPNEPYFGRRTWVSELTGYLLRSLFFGQDPRAAGQPAAGLPWGSLVHFFQGVRLLGQGVLLFYLATRTRSGAARATANPDWERFLMESQYDATAREILARYGAGDFNQPADLQPLAALPGGWWRRLAAPFGRAEQNVAGDPVVFVPGALLRPGNLFQKYLLRLLLEFHLRNFYARSRMAAAAGRESSTWSWWDQARHRLEMALSPAGYLAAQLGRDNSPLSRQLQAGGALAGVYRSWARFPSEQNARFLLAGMIKVAGEQGTREERAASARTLLALFAAMPAWGGSRVGVWQPAAGRAGREVFFPLWLLDANERRLPGRVLDLIEKLPLNLDNRELAPRPRPGASFDQAA